MFSYWCNHYVCPPSHTNMILTANNLGQTLLVVSHCVIVHCASINFLLFFLHMKLCLMVPNSKTLRWWKIKSKFVWHHVVQFGSMKWNLMMIMNLKWNLENGKYGSLDNAGWWIWLNWCSINENCKLLLNMCVMYYCIFYNFVGE